MGYTQLIQDELANTEAMLGVQQEEIDTDLSRKQGIDQLLRTLVGDQDLLDFLTARDASAVLVSKDLIAVSLDGSGTITLERRRGLRRHVAEYELKRVHLETERGTLVDKYKRFIDEDHCTFMCSYSTIANPYISTYRFLAELYDNSAFRDQTAETIRQNLSSSLDLILQKSK